MFRRSLDVAQAALEQSQRELTTSREEILRYTHLYWLQFLITGFLILPKSLASFPCLNLWLIPYIIPWLLSSTSISDSFPKSISGSFH
jgi:hypothetical protein